MYKNVDSNITWLNLSLVTKIRMIILLRLPPSSRALMNSFFDNLHGLVSSAGLRQNQIPGAGAQVFSPGGGGKAFLDEV